MNLEETIDGKAQVQWFLEWVSMYVGTQKIEAVFGRQQAQMFTKSFPLFWYKLTYDEKKMMVEWFWNDLQSKRLDYRVVEMQMQPFILFDMCVRGIDASQIRNNRSATTSEFRKAGSSEKIKIPTPLPRSLSELIAYIWFNHPSHSHLLNKMENCTENHACTLFNLLDVPNRIRFITQMEKL